MIRFDDAYKCVLDSARVLEPETASLPELLGRVLAEDIKSDIDMPPFDKSAMDGYACRRCDLPGPLTVVETIAAGYEPQRKVGAGQCAKIMTGAAVPAGADCVIMVEHTKTLDSGLVRFTGKTTNDNICPQGEDVREGEVVLRRGTCIAPQHIAVLAAVGCCEPRVHRRARVGIIATGDELVEPGQRPGPSQIRTSNSHQLWAQVQRAGAVPVYHGIARDTEAELSAALQRASTENDVIILSGGVSKGEFDLVPGIMRAAGFTLLFDAIAIKPGKPTTFGVRPNRWCFGLPGNPVSTFIQFEILIKPFLYRLMGHDYRAAEYTLPLAAPLRQKKGDRDAWIPVALAEDGVRACEFHGSAHIHALAGADGLVCIPAGVTELKEGTSVRVRPL